MNKESVQTCISVENNYHELIQLIDIIENDMQQIKTETVDFQDQPDVDQLTLIRDKINSNNIKCKLLLNTIRNNPRLMLEVASKLQIPFIGNALDEIQRSLYLTDYFICYLDISIGKLKRIASV